MIRTLDDELEQHILSLPTSDQGDWLFLVPHDEFEGAWYVDSLHPDYLFDFEDLIGQYRVLFPSQFDEFKQRATELTYEIALVGDPGIILDPYRALSEPPPVTLHGDLDGNIKGFLPWQVEGFNKLIKPTHLKGGLCLWDTGTGKTAFVASGILWHIVTQREAQLALVVVKSNNKRDMQKKLKQLGDIDSLIIDGPWRYRNAEGEWVPGKRQRGYKKARQRLSAGEPTVLIFNYEKFREDQEVLTELITDRKVLIFWDEMPSKLRNRTTQLYNAVRDTLYEPYRKAIYWDRKRPSWLRQYELTATPIENDPGDQFSCVRLIDPKVLGTVSEFEKEHVVARNYFSKKPERWGRIDKMSHRLDHMVHRVDKDQPEVAKYFPKLIDENVYIDWNPKQGSVYDSTLAMLRQMIEDDEENVSVMSAIMVLQMMCDAPSMVLKSAENRETWDEMLALTLEHEDPSFIKGLTTGSDFAMMAVAAHKGKITNEGHSKLSQLKEDLLEKFPDDKVLFFSTWSNYIFPTIEEHLNEWGVTYEVYRGTDKQRQQAKDNWRRDSDCRILVSSDAGADSVDLPEAGLVINFNLPFLFSLLVQRRNRASRADSVHETLRVRNYIMADSVEERREELIEQRKNYHNDFVGLATHASHSSGYSREAMMYMLGLGEA